MTKGQVQGVISIAIAFVIATIGGIALSFLAINTLKVEQVLFLASLIFLLTLPFFVYGIYTYAKHTQEKSTLTNDEMEKPRLLLDLLREHGQADVLILAEQLETTPQAIKSYIENLNQLELFSGIADWENNVIAIFNPTVIGAIDRCKSCDNPISIETGRTVCSTCGTEYYKP